jgi:hypothetical protein
MNQLEYLLFSKKIGVNNSILFNRPVDIVKALRSNSSSAYYKPDGLNEVDKSFNNLKVNVSRILKGKPTTSNLLVESLIEVIRPLINPEEEVEVIIEEIKRLLVKDNKIYSASNYENDITELNNLYINSKTQVVFNARPEESYDNKRANDFFKSILESLSILNDTLNSHNVKKRYEYHFSNSFIAIDFFDLLMVKAIEIKGEKFEKALKKYFQDLNEKNFIRIYVVDDLFTVFPHTIFNHLSQDICGFTFFSKDANSFSIAKMSRAALQRWYREVYLRVKFSRQEISFERYLEYKTNAPIDKIGQDLSTIANRFKSL